MSSKDESAKNLFEGLIEALADKHSQIDINFQKTSAKIPGIQQSVELNGLVTISLHMRELTQEEKRASAQKNVAVMVSTRLQTS